MFALQHISAVFVADRFYPLMVMLLNYQVLWQTRQGSRVQPIWDYCRCCSYDMIVEVGLVTQVSFRSCLFLQCYLYMTAHLILVILWLQL